MILVWVWVVLFSFEHGWVDNKMGIGVLYLINVVVFCMEFISCRFMLNHWQEDDAAGTIILTVWRVEALPSKENGLESAFSAWFTIGTPRLLLG